MMGVKKPLKGGAMRIDLPQGTGNVYNVIITTTALLSFPNTSVSSVNSHTECPQFAPQRSQPIGLMRNVAWLKDSAGAVRSRTPLHTGNSSQRHIGVRAHKRAPLGLLCSKQSELKAYNYIRFN